VSGLASLPLPSIAAATPFSNPLGTTTLTEGRYGHSASLHDCEASGGDGGGGGGGGGDGGGDGWGRSPLGVSTSSWAGTPVHPDQLVSAMGATLRAIVDSLGQQQHHHHHHGLQQPEPQQLHASQQQQEQQQHHGLQQPEPQQPLAGLTKSCKCCFVFFASMHYYKTRQDVLKWVCLADLHHL